MSRACHIHALCSADLANFPTLVGEDVRRRLYVTKTTLDWEVRGLTCPGTQHIQDKRNEIIDDGSDRVDGIRRGRQFAGARRDSHTGDSCVPSAGHKPVLRGSERIAVVPSTGTRRRSRAVYRLQPGQPAGSDGERPAAGIRSGQATGREGKQRQVVFTGPAGVHLSLLSSYLRRESGYRDLPDGEHSAGQYLQRDVARGSGGEYTALLQLDWLLCVAGVSELEQSRFIGAPGSRDRSPDGNAAQATGAASRR